MNSESKERIGSCRFCQSPLQHTFVDLGMSPLCEDFLKPAELKNMEAFYPLHVYVCSECFLVQLEEFVSPQEIYKDYKYFSYYSDSFFDHAKRYTEKMLVQYHITDSSLVAELASNEGYLLQYFAAKGIPVLGIEPAVNAARLAEEKGIRTEIKFFGNATVGDLIDRYGQADLLIGNNVLAH